MESYNKKFICSFKCYCGLVLLSLIAGCGGGSGSQGVGQVLSTEEAMDARTLSSSDFDFSRGTKKSASSAEWLINNDAAFFVDWDSVLDSTDNCIGRVVTDSMEMLDLGDGEYELFGPAVDVTHCGKLTDYNINYSTASFYIRVQIVNENDVPISYLGKQRVYDIATYEDDLYKVRRGRIALKSFVEFDVYDNLAQPHKASVYLAILREGLEPGTECITDVLNDRIVGCKEYSFTQADLDSLFFSDVIVSMVEYSDIYAQHGSPYYYGNNIGFQFNNWRGVMSYHDSNPNIAPEYQATNGVTQINGVYSYPVYR